MDHGPSVEDGGILFRPWAPSEKRVEVVIEGRDDPVAMAPAANGFFAALVEKLGAGARYRFALPSGRQVPDPASRFQPDDVDGPSEAIEPSGYHWRESWQGREWEDRDQRPEPPPRHRRSRRSPKPARPK